MLKVILLKKWARGENAHISPIVVKNKNESFNRTHLFGHFFEILMSLLLNGVLDISARMRTFLIP